LPKTRPSKPKKPYRDFPLTAHRNGQWCKKIKGRLHYFGPVTDPDGALAKYLEERDDLQAGRIPRRARGKATTADVVNAYLERCEKRVQTGELSAVSFADYLLIGKLLVKHLGRSTDPEQLRPSDFAAFRTVMAGQYAPSRLSKIVVTTRGIIKWAHASGLIDMLPRFGPDFQVASKKTARIQRVQQGKKLLNREEIFALLEAADAKWKAIVLLSINAGWGNSDIARLKLSDVGGEWLDMPRGKTGVDRRVPLWTETQQAILEAIRHRPKPKLGAEDVLFLSGHGQSLIRVRSNGKRTDLTVEGFRRLAKAARVYRPRMGLYWLRHTFATISDEARDAVATSALLGRVDQPMAGHYRQRIDDDRLRRVTDHVRQWLFDEVDIEPVRATQLRVVG
jgi:integrase